MELSKPLEGVRFTWAEYLWMGVPIGLVYSAGLWGLVVGSLAIGTNAWILQSGGSRISRYGLSALVSTLAIVLGVVVAGAWEFLILPTPGGVR